MDHKTKDNSGALFINDRKDKETQPDFKGNIIVKGVKYYISAWDNVSKTGDAYLSLALTEVDQQSQTNKSTGISARFKEDAIKEQANDQRNESDIPF